MRMERIWRAMALLLCTLLAVLTGHTASAEEETDTSAKAAVLIERRTGRVLLAHQESLPLPMASTTKVMTALLALENASPDERVTAGKNAFGVPGTSIYLSEGESLTLRELLYGLLMASGNDAAVAIAEHVSGSVDEFCALMTRRARELGCEQSFFVNPHGLPAQGHQTTALELALIAREAMRHELFREIVSTQRASIPWEGRAYDRILNNKNRLLAEYPGAFGIKTGYTKAAGRCLVFGAKQNGMEVIGVVLNCADWFDEAERLMDKGFARYELYTAYSAGELLRAVPMDGDRLASVCAERELCAVVPRGTVPQLRILLPDTLPSGLEAGATVGEASLTQGEEVLATVPLTLSESTSTADYTFELERVLRQWLPFPVAMDGT